MDGKKREKNPATKWNLKRKKKKRVWCGGCTSLFRTCIWHSVCVCGKDDKEMCGGRKEERNGKSMTQKEKLFPAIICEPLRWYLPFFYCIIIPLNNASTPLSYPSWTNLRGRHTLSARLFNYRNPIAPALQPPKWCCLKDIGWLEFRWGLFWHAGAFFFLF